MKKLFLLIITAVIITPVIAQEAKPNKVSRREEKKLRIAAIAKQEEEGIIKYRKQTVFGLKLTTDGYGGFLEIARAKSVKRAMLFQLDISERKHNKEEKQQSILSYYGNDGPYIYGKRNFVYPVKLGVQEQFLLGNKGNKNGVCVTANIGGGISLALLRPYELDLTDSLGSSNHKFRTYDPSDTSLAFLNYYRILGGPNFGTGWNKLKLTPGVYAKGAVRFDFGKYNELVNAIEVGLTYEYYTKKIQQMILNKEKQFFFSAYVSLIFGKRK